MQHLSRLIIVAIAVTGCAYLTPQDETSSPTEASSSPVGDVVVSPAEDAPNEVPDTNQSGQTTVTTTPATTPTTTIPEPLGVAELILTAGGLGEAAFGSEPDAIISYVSSILGSPTEDSDWTTPETFLLQPCFFTNFTAFFHGFAIKKSMIFIPICGSDT